MQVKWKNYVALDKFRYVYLKQAVDMSSFIYDFLLSLGESLTLALVHKTLPNPNPALPLQSLL